MADKSVMVLVDASGENTVESVSAEAQKNGLRIDRVMRGMKTIVGTVDDDATIERVRKLNGVASIREDRTVSLPPRDPSIPQ